jgi:hypothetical protein
MAMIQCKMHDLQGVKCVCSHIQKAVLDGIDISCTKTRGDDFLIPFFWLCDQCKSHWETIDDEIVKDEFIETMTMICGVCFDEWREALTNS